MAKEKSFTIIGEDEINLIFDRISELLMESHEVKKEDREAKKLWNIKENDFKEHKDMLVNELTRLCKQLAETDPSTYEYQHIASNIESLKNILNGRY